MTHNGITNRTVFRLCYLDGDWEASHTVCHLLPIPVDSGLRFRCCRCRPPKEKKRQKAKSKPNKRRKNNNLSKLTSGAASRYYSTDSICWTHCCLATRSASYFLLSSAAVSARLPPPASLSPPQPLLLLALLPGVFVCMPKQALFHLGSVPPRHETTRRFGDPSAAFFEGPLAAAGQSTVSIPNNEGEVPVDPSLALDTTMSSIRRRARVFPGRHGPGFSPPNIINIIRRVSRPGFARSCDVRPPQKGNAFHGQSSQRSRTVPS